MLDGIIIARDKSVIQRLKEESKKDDKGQRSTMKTNMDQQLAWFMRSRGRESTVAPPPPTVNDSRKSARSSFLVPSSPVVSQAARTPKTRSGSTKKKSSTPAWKSWAARRQG